MAAPTAPQIRDAWESVADGFDRHVTPHTLALGAQIVSSLQLRPGLRVLDIAAGSGALALPAARAGADVIAADIAPTMVERLRARAAEDGLAIEARVEDGTALDFEDDTFDVTVSLNGVSLFPDLEAGIAEAVRVTRPGGTVAIGTFGPLPDVEFIAFFLGALRALVPDRLPKVDGPLPPFRLSDPTVFRTTLEGGGLHDVAIDTVRFDTSFDDVDHLLEVLLASNPIAGMLTAGLTDGERDELRGVLDGMLRERSGGHAGATLGATVHVGRGIV